MSTKTVTLFCCSCFGHPCTLIYIQKSIRIASESLKSYNLFVNKHYHFFCLVVGYAILFYCLGLPYGDTVTLVNM